MELHQIVLAVAVLAVGLAAGVFFTFTTLIVPGLRDMDPRSTLQSFQAIDRRLQPDPPSIDGQPAFGAALGGAAVLTVAAAILGWPHFSTTTRTLAVTAAAVYNLGFLVPTLTTILPFNNSLRGVDLDTMSEAEVATRRADFDRTWRGWNLVRTASSAAAFALLVVVALAGGG
ncbi:DUF1772 domain-containing protein [Actinotalea sp. BY-33]|uniref:DUF1772 domain-containing protein n=1 Tax=Actinotalea soli TaxID=2819234 RepID=A0A939LQE9_9CELL|nr:DUF1772 domain-containing protein [Actinotalea soli]MBO1752098.1 DUF1772 domain-containing protein [Actinotalea soli]